MKSTLLLSLSFFLVCGAVSAQAKTPVETLLEVTRYEETAIESAVAAFDGMIDQLKQQGVPEAAIKEIRTEARALYVKIFSGKEMRTKTEELYTKHFTEEEILELTEFYRTPLGQKTLSATPAIMTDVMKIAMPAIQKEMPTFQQKIGEIVEKHTAGAPGKKDAE
ncbi:DUF2059 domain-containing protein [Luteolibacter flavescens]|uniref:DUF2059 domain-containing protein n=1 Tax=Luteolibacter flavescens TaxID=1859460 RepID=A0ABT3FVK8_9BACT|nr:DUF2059 domain-containing protein [Luteolibacter flavescens]MCW1887582.1 DUF2059 domain-containing protein [Luteolibacter flavescens]